MNNIEEQPTNSEEVTEEIVITDPISEEEDVQNSSEPEDLQTVSTATALTNMDMMTKIANDKQTLEDIKNLTSSKVTDQLKVFLVSQARNELMRVVKLTQFLDTLESKFMDQVNKSITDDSLTLKQYTDVITVITQLLARANDTISRVLRDDSLMTILNTTIYNSDSAVQSTSVIANLKDPQSRERVRSIINVVLQNTKAYQQDSDVVTINNTEGDGTDEVQS